MARDDFAPEEYAARRGKLFAEMGARGLDHFLVFHPTCIHWLTGAEAKSYQSFQCLVADAPNARLVMLTRRAEINEFADDAEVDALHEWGGSGFPEPVAALLALAGELGFGHGARVGMEVPAYYLHPHHYRRLRDGFSVPPEELPDLVHDLRLVRSPAEIAYLREAGRIADLSMRAVRKAIAPGRTERALAAALYRAILEAGGDPPTVPPNIVSGPRASYSHGAATARILEPGDSGNAEYCVPFRRYTVSIGRTFSVGRPGARLQRLHDVVLRAADAAIAVIRDGVPASKPDAAINRVLSEAGLATHRVHTNGYSVAPAFPPATGEVLQFSPASRHVLRAGMSLSISPNLFLKEERLGVRIVDNVLVTGTGVEFLTNDHRELIVAAD